MSGASKLELGGPGGRRGSAVLTDPDLREGCGAQGSPGWNQARVGWGMEADSLSGGRFRFRVSGWYQYCKVNPPCWPLALLGGGSKLGVRPLTPGFILCPCLGGCRLGLGFPHGGCSSVSTEAPASELGPCTAHLAGESLKLLLRVGSLKL